MNPEWPPDKSSDCHAVMEPIAVVSLNRWWLVSSTFVDGLTSSHMREPETALDVYKKIEREGLERRESSKKDGALFSQSASRAPLR